jgi:MFS family permease
MGLGPLLGGALVETVSWRWLFWLNLPFCLLGVVLVLASTAEQRDETAARRIDAPGVITVGLGLAAAWVGTPALLRARQRGLNGLAERRRSLLTAALAAVVRPDSGPDLKSGKREPLWDSFWAPGLGLFGDGTCACGAGARGRGT